jgi:hypothetical protein
LQHRRNHSRDQRDAKQREHRDCPLDERPAANASLVALRMNRGVALGEGSIEHWVFLPLSLSNVFGMSGERTLTC